MFINLVDTIRETSTTNLSSRQAGCTNLNTNSRILGANNTQQLVYSFLISESCLAARQVRGKKCQLLLWFG